MTTLYCNVIVNHQNDP